AERPKPRRVSSVQRCSLPSRAVAALERGEGEQQLAASTTPGATSLTGGGWRAYLRFVAKGAVALAAAVVALGVPGGAQATPPPNDDRANAATIPTLPATIPGTVVDATLERLDPQVSQCGRIEATV